MLAATSRVSLYNMIYIEEKIRTKLRCVCRLEMIDSKEKCYMFEKKNPQIWYQSFLGSLKWMAGRPLSEKWETRILSLACLLSDPTLRWTRGMSALGFGPSLDSSTFLADCSLQLHWRSRTPRTSLRTARPEVTAIAAAATDGPIRQFLKKLFRESWSLLTANVRIAISDAAFRVRSCGILTLPTYTKLSHKLRAWASPFIFCFLASSAWVNLVILSSSRRRLLMGRLNLAFEASLCGWA